MNSKKRPELWSCDEYAEELTHKDLDAAIEDYLDQLEGDFPETVKVYGYARMQAHLDRARLLEDVLERLDEDEELGRPDGDWSTPTELMKHAAEVFCAIIEAEYVPWACEQVETREIDVRRWCAIEHPNWLDQFLGPRPVAIEPEEGSPV